MINGEWSMVNQCRLVKQKLNETMLRQEQKVGSKQQICVCVPSGTQGEVDTVSIN